MLFCGYVPWCRRPGLVISPSSSAHRQCNAHPEIEGLCRAKSALAGIRSNGNKRGPRLRCCTVDMPHGAVVPASSYRFRHGPIVSFIITGSSSGWFNDLTLFLGTQDTVLGHLAPYLSWMRQILPSLPLRMSPASKRPPKMMLLEQQRVPRSLAGPMGAFLVSGDFLLLL
jgi:hypothetical protein